MNNKKKIILAIIAVVALVSILAVCMCACGKKDEKNANEESAESYVKRLEKRGYEVYLSDTPGEFAYMDIEWQIAAFMEIDETEIEVVITRFVNSADATAYYDDESLCLDPNDEAYMEGYDVKKIGNIVFFGNEQAVKDAIE